MTDVTRILLKWNQATQARRNSSSDATWRAGGSFLITSFINRQRIAGSNLSDRIMNTSVKWAAELSHVREVTLLGLADLAFWKDQLMDQDLRPSEHDGQAQLLLVAADSKYMGIRFRELSFSVLVSPQEVGAEKDAVYLVRAFNSSRLFTFCEQVFFSTPYRHGDVRISASFPFAVRVLKNGEALFEAQMQADPSGFERQTSHHEEGGWEGPIFLPGTSRRKGRNGKLFFSRLRGDTKTYPFLHAKDSVTIKLSADYDILQALTESHFVAKEWVVRADATHARSKTYKRANVLPAMTKAEAAPAAR